MIDEMRQILRRRSLLGTMVQQDGLAYVYMGGLISWRYGGLEGYCKNWNHIFTYKERL